jgi:hypothetical protein
MFGGRRGFNHLIPAAEIDTPKRSFSVTYGHAKWAFLKERKREHKNGKNKE